MEDGLTRERGLRRALVVTTGCCLDVMNHSVLLLKNQEKPRCSFQLSSPAEIRQTAPNSPSNGNECTYRVLSPRKAPWGLGIWPFHWESVMQLGASK